MHYSAELVVEHVGIAWVRRSTGVLAQFEFKARSRQGPLPDLLDAANYETLVHRYSRPARKYLPVSQAPPSGQGWPKDRKLGTKVA